MALGSPSYTQRHEFGPPLQHSHTPIRDQGGTRRPGLPGLHVPKLKTFFLERPPRHGCAFSRGGIVWRIAPGSTWVEVSVRRYSTNSLINAPLWTCGGIVMVPRT